MHEWGVIVIKWVKNLLLGPDFIVDGGITWHRESLGYRNPYFRKLYIDRILAEWKRLDALEAGERLLYLED